MAMDMIGFGRLTNLETLYGLSRQTVCMNSADFYKSVIFLVFS